MELREICERLRSYGDVMLLEAPATPGELGLYEGENFVTLPPELRELLSCFNGGEIFVPGTVIYGVQDERPYSLACANVERYRQSVPEGYLVFARLNFGDLMAIGLEEPHDVIQWDHEMDEEFDRWDSLSQWLQQTIEDYEADEGAPS